MRAGTARVAGGDKWPGRCCDSPIFRCNTTPRGPAARRLGGERAPAVSFFVRGASSPRVRRALPSARGRDSDRPDDDCGACLVAASPAAPPAADAPFEPRRRSALARGRFRARVRPRGAPRGDVEPAAPSRHVRRPACREPRAPRGASSTTRAGARARDARLPGGLARAGARARADLRVSNTTPPTPPAAYCGLLTVTRAGLPPRTRASSRSETPRASRGGGSPRVSPPWSSRQRRRP